MSSKDLRLKIANSKQIAEYKQKIIASILENKELTDIIDSNIDASELPYNNIFPFGKIPGAVDEAKAYITIEVSMPNVSTANYFFKEIVIVLNIVCHDDLMKVEGLGMTRIDAIGIALEDLFSGSNDFGFGEVELVSNVEGAWTERHSYRQLRFRTKEPTKTRC